MPNLVDRRIALRLALFLLAVLLTAPAAPAAELVNRVVIRVNDRIVTLHDYQERIADLQEEVSRREDLTLAQRREILANAPEDVFNNLLQEALMLSRADQLGIVFTEEEVDERIRRMRESYGVGTDEEFEAVLAQQGMDLRRFREQVRSGMRIQELLGREVRSQLQVGEELARVYYRDYPEQFMSPQRLYLQEAVVLEDSDLDREERLELARSIRAELMTGRSLAETVEEYREQGLTSGAIDLGWVVGGDLARELQDAVWDLEPLEISEPVESRGGIHLIQVVEREEEGLRDFAEVAEDAERRATNVAFGEAMEKFMEELEEQSYVRLDPPPEAADFRRAVGEPLDELPEVAPEDVTVADGMDGMEDEGGAGAEGTAADEAMVEPTAEPTAEVPTPEADEPPAETPPGTAG